MQPGLYYVSEINKLLAAANREAKASAKALPGLLKPLYAQFDAELAKMFPGSTRESTWGKKNRKLMLGDGIVVEISADNLDPKTSLGRIRTAIVAAEKADAEVCAIRCALEAEKDTASINRFRAYVRSVYGATPAPSDIADAFIGFRAPSEAHNCPIPKRRQA